MVLYSLIIYIIVDDDDNISLKYKYG
jgi:hypothetical protein